jgi:holo-[acyl-carrier protein] synthase
MIVGIGIDIVDIARVARLVGRHPERALQRLFTLREVDYCRVRARSADHFAARIAAKEATYKALGGAPAAQARGIAWKDIEIVARTGAPPTLELHGSARRAADALGVRRALVTLTHDAMTAAAFVILESE